MWEKPEFSPAPPGRVEPRRRYEHATDPLGPDVGVVRGPHFLGHDPLFNRSMNAALAFHEGFVYVGNRTDGSSRCGLGDPRRVTLGLDACPHPNPGILVVDATDPSDPAVVNEIGPPHAGNVSETTRELRVWTREDLLMVASFACSSVIHSCVPGAVTPTFRFFDVSDPANPTFLSEWVPRQANGLIRTPHEFYLWEDPNDPERAMLWISTPVANRPTWDNPNPGHSAVPFPGRPFSFITDEVYGTFTDDEFGCPWGWARTLQVAQPGRPRIMGEYRLPENSCPAPTQADQERAAYTSHNPTLTRNLALVTWHSGGFQAIDIEDPAHMQQGGWFSPTPLAAVANEDPALGMGTNKVVMWSFPIVSDGLIYVVDIRNGLYILRYTGPRSGEVSGLSFLEGNSNLGDAVRLDKSGG